LVLEPEQEMMRLSWVGHVAVRRQGELAWIITITTTTPIIT
jgi:hypothetical protein